MKCYDAPRWMKGGIHELETGIGATGTLESARCLESRGGFGVRPALERCRKGPDDGRVFRSRRRPRSPFGRVLAFSPRRRCRGRGARLGRQRLAHRSSAPRLEHRRPSAASGIERPGRSVGRLQLPVAHRSLRPRPERGQTQYRLRGGRHRLVPEVDRRAIVAPRFASGASIRRRLYERRRVAERPAPGQPSLRLHYFRLRHHAVPAPRCRQRAGCPRAQRRQEQPLVFGLRHLPPRLANRYGRCAPAVVGRVRHHAGTQPGLGYGEGGGAG